MKRSLPLLVALAATAAGAEPAAYTTHELVLPGAGPDGVLMDYIVFDPATGFVWVPAGNTGAVDVVDTATGKVSQATGWKTREMERNGRKRTVGPSAASVGGGV